MKTGLLALIDHYLTGVREYAKGGVNPKTALAFEGFLLAAKDRIEFLQQVVERLRPELEQAQATVKEMGGLIDQQAAELERLKLNVNYMVEGCTCNRAQGIPVEDVQAHGATHTHKTKGGYYRLLGPLKPAGELKEMVAGWDLHAYQDVFTQQVYARSNDFHTALEPL